MLRYAISRLSMSREDAKASPDFMNYIFSDIFLLILLSDVIGI
jgi:hypothetical protein